MNSKEKTIQQLQTAEHLLKVTFPLVRDPKLLIGIVHNLNSCIDYAMEDVLDKELLVPKSLNGKIELLRKKYNPPPEHIEFIRKINRLISLYKESPVVFKRGNKQIICNENYDVEVLSVKEVENLISKAKEFLSHAGVL